MTFDVTSHWNTLFMHPHRLVDPGSWVRHIPLAFLLIDLARPKTLVELGVHTGNSFCSFCQAVRHFQTTTLCYGVDTFQGDHQAGHYEDEVYEALLNHISDHYQDFAQLLRMTFDEATGAFSDGTIDLLHIDGLHTYEAVRHDFDTWLPKMSEKGIVVFHDISARHEDFGAWKVWDELMGAYPSFGFRHGYGLGLLAVGQNVPEPVCNFLDAMHQDERLEPVFVTAGDRLANTLQVSLLKERSASLEIECEKLRTYAEKLEQLRSDQELQIREQKRILQEKNRSLQEQRREALKLENQLQRELLKLKNQLQRTLAEKDSLLKSLSWRLTSPLRRVGRIFEKRSQHL